MKSKVIRLNQDEIELVRSSISNEIVLYNSLIRDIEEGNKKDTFCNIDFYRFMVRQLNQLLSKKFPFDFIE